MHPTNEVMLISRFDGFLWWEYKKKLVDLIIGHIKPAKWMFKMVICTTSKWCICPHTSLSEFDKFCILERLNIWIGQEWLN